MTSEIDLKAILSDLKSNDPVIRRKAIVDAGNHRIEGAVEELLPLLNIQDRDLIHALAYALTRIGTPQAIEALKREIEQSPYIRSITNALWGTAPEDPEASIILLLHAILHTDDYKVGRDLLCAAEDAGEPASELIIRFISDSLIPYLPRSVALEALSQIKTERVKVFLRELAESDNHPLREEARITLEHY